MHRTARFWVHAFAACAAACAATTTGAVYGASDGLNGSTSYFYDANGRQAVVPSKSDVLVKLRATSGAPHKLRPSWLGEAVVPGIAAHDLRTRRLAQAVQKVETELTERGLHVSRGAVSAAAAAGKPDVEWALPVLHQPGTEVPIYLTDEIIVRFDPATAPAEAERVIRQAGCSVVRRDPVRTGRLVVRVTNPMKANPLAVANALHETPGVRYAHPDFILVRQACAGGIDDPLYEFQWNLHPVAGLLAAPNSGINVEAAWSLNPLGEGRPDVRVAIIDDSVEIRHPDLAPNYVTGRDYDYEPGYDEDPSPDYPDEVHGTACAGIAVGAANTLGVRGVAPRCGLIAVKFFGSTLSETADAFYFVMNPKGTDPGTGEVDHSQDADVISNSWGFVNGTFLPTDLAEAIDYVATEGRSGKGCVVLFAAANNSYTVNGVTALGQMGSVMCIGGTNSFATHSEFSDVGPEVAVVAPTSDSFPPRTREAALDILTTDNTSWWGYNTADGPAGDYTDTFGGTSAATPTVAGVCALVISQNPALTATQVRSIVEHTAVQIDPEFAQIDGISGHSHRYGYGRVDAGAAVLAAAQGVTWPAPVRNLQCTPAGSNVVVSWTNPSGDYASTLVVRSTRPFAWRPTDGNTYAPGQTVAPGVIVVQNAALTQYSLTNPAPNGYFFGVYACSPQNRYSWGRSCHIFHRAQELFYDDGEGSGADWVHGGDGDVWERGTPTSYTSIWEQAVYGGGPLSGTRNNGDRAIGGNNCWGTGFSGYTNPPFTYAPNSAAYLRTPLINVPDVNAPVFLTFYDWCMLETPFDYCTIKVLDENNAVLQTLAAKHGGCYDWTQRVYTVGTLPNRRIRIQFEVVSDSTIERSGWFIDEVRVVLAAPPCNPPVASNVAVEVWVDTSVNVTLVATDPDPADPLTFSVKSLPAHGTLRDPGNGAIGTVPLHLVNNGRVVAYTPTPGYVGTDQFTFQAGDGTCNSNVATVTVTVKGYNADFNGDNDVDLDDFRLFRMCYNGPNQIYLFPECQIVDFDVDSDVDLSDFQIFMTCFNGPNNPPRSPCRSTP